MKYLLVGIVFFVVVSPYSGADTFGTGANQFTIDFVTISGDAKCANGTKIYECSPDNPRPKRTFTDPEYSYRIGKYEITVNQWQKAGFDGGSWLGEQPAASISWYRAAQFVNRLNTIKGYQPAYNFTELEGTEDYIFALWDESVAWGGTNLYRHKDAYYFLPSEDEWVKAAYWNGASLRTYATKNNAVPIAGVHTNYGNTNWEPWAVGSGCEELNGTYDMMGNVLEWMESPLYIHNYSPEAARVFRGGSYFNGHESSLQLCFRQHSGGAGIPQKGFRIAAKPYCSEPILGDLNNDCRVDLADLAIMVSNWLRCNIEPQTACWE